MDILSYTFFQYALAGVLLVSLASAVVGTLVVARRMVLVTGGITHACFGGLGLGFYAGVNPLLPAAVVAVASALGIEWMSARGNVRQDSATGVLWALGMALGTIFIFLTPGYVPELTSFLFGNILTITATDLAVMAAFVAALLAGLAVGHRYVVACAFDSDFAATQGIPVRTVNALMTMAIAITVVLTIRLIGIMLLMSLFTIPQMIAETATRRLSRIMWVSALVSVACSVAGLLLSALVEVPASATIVLLLIACYAVARIIQAVKS